MLTGVVERDTGTRDEVLYGPGNDHLARARRVHNARREMNGDAENIGFGPLHLAGMQAGADFDAKRGHGFGDGLGTMDRARRAIEQNQKSIAQGFHLAAAKACHFPANRRVMRLQQFAPRLVAHFTRPQRRGDDIGE